MAIADDLQNAHERGLPLGILVDEHGISLVSGDVFEDISRLAFEHLAQHVECTETDCPDFAGFDAREIDVGDSHLVSKLVQRDMPIRHDLVEMKNDWHRTHLYRIVRKFLQENAVFEYIRKGEDSCCRYKGSKIDRHNNVTRAVRRNKSRTKSTHLKKCRAVS